MISDWRRAARLGSWCGLALCAWAAMPAAAAAASALPASVEVVGRPAATDAVEFELMFPLRNGAELDRLLAAQATPGSPDYRRFLTPAEFRARFGLTAETAAAATQLLSQSGLEVTEQHAQGLRVRGAVASVERTFGGRYATLRAAGDGATRRSLTGGALPAGLATLGAAMPPLGSLTLMRPRSERIDVVPHNRYSTYIDYWFTDLKQAYSFPSYKTVTGKGRTIGIISISDVNRDDLKLYFGHEKLAPPNVTVRNIKGGAPFDPDGGGTELDLDLQQAGGMAPGAKLIVYNASDGSDDTFLAAVSTMIEDNKIDIASTSYGACELYYLDAYAAVFGSGGNAVLQAYDDLFRQGNAQGITFVAASGDNGAFDCVSAANFTTRPTDPPRVAGKPVRGVDFPASSPHVTGVGGTNLVTTQTPGSLDSRYVRENANDDPLIPTDPYGTGNLVKGDVWGSGGGFSTFFKAPSYQASAKTGSSFRAVPDVAMHMGGCPGDALQPCNGDRSDDIAVVDGSFAFLIGTSASAPDFAGVLALWEELLGGKRLGNVNPTLYALGAKNKTGHYFRQDIPGNNGVYKTKAGYNEVLGLGTPIVKNLLGIPNDPGAGVPQTPSNP